MSLLLMLRLALLQGSLPKFSNQDNPAAFHPCRHVRQWICKSKAFRKIIFSYTIRMKIRSRDKDSVISSEIKDSNIEPQLHKSLAKLTLSSPKTSMSLESEKGRLTACSVNSATTLTMMHRNPVPIFLGKIAREGEFGIMRKL
ncbi:unnamed protein product [Timema podura]|uniref:Uncharacterized protein n=1 Tax=Timema podura TaxID=61482 RepID=A0ABN7NJW4_TIMPD|nr:unnamed protein product [Timema podura]